MYREKQQVRLGKWSLTVEQGLSFTSRFSGGRKGAKGHKRGISESEDEATGTGPAKKPVSDDTLVRMDGPRHLANAMGTGKVMLSIEQMQQEWSDLSRAKIVHGVTGLPMNLDLTVISSENYLKLLLWQGERIEKESLEGHLGRIQGRLDSLGFHVLCDAGLEDLGSHRKDLANSLFTRWTDDLLRQRGEVPRSFETGRGHDPREWLLERLIDVLYPASKDRSPRIQEEQEIVSREEYSGSEEQRRNLARSC